MNCDPKILKKITNSYLKILEGRRRILMERPYLSDTPLLFQAVVDNTDVVLLGIDTWRYMAEAMAYSTQTQYLIDFLFKNKIQLAKLGLIKDKGKHLYIANSIYESAAICKITKNGFRYKDMIKEIEKMEK